MSYMFKSFWSFFSLICFFSVLISFYSLYSCSLIIHHLYLLLSLFIEQCIIFLFLKFLFGYSWYISLYSFCRDFSGFVKTSCVCFSDVSLITYWNILMAHACSVSQSCLALCDPMDDSPPGFSAHGVFQTRILEWVAIFYSRGSSRPRDWTRISCNSRRILYHCVTWKAKVIATCL